MRKTSQSQGKIKETSNLADRLSVIVAPALKSRRSVVPMRGELPIPEMRLPFGPTTVRLLWLRFLAAVTCPDFLAVLYFCLIVMLLAAAVIQRFPNFGEVALSLQALG
jgi:hypothetical protein